LLDYPLYPLPTTLALVSSADVNVLIEVPLPGEHALAQPAVDSTCSLVRLRRSTYHQLSVTPPGDQPTLAATAAFLHHTLRAKEIQEILPRIDGAQLRWQYPSLALSCLALPHAIIPSATH
jgi:hypothetical protein